MCVTCSWGRGHLKAEQMEAGRPPLPRAELGLCGPPGTTRGQGAASTSRQDTGAGDQAPGAQPAAQHSPHGPAAPKGLRRGHEVPAGTVLSP